MIRDRGTLDRAIRDADRIGNPLTPRVTEALDRTMELAYRDMQGMVPVDLSSLKNSGRSGTDVRDFGKTWIGWAAWGGPSSPREVDYAVFALAEGGENDWLRNAHVYEAEFLAVIEAGIREHLR